MDKHSVGPGGARHRSVPMITNCELLGQSFQNRNLIRRVTFQYLRYLSLLICFGTGRGVRSDEAGAVDRRVVSPARVPGVRPTQLTQHVSEFVPWLDHHREVCGLSDRCSRAILGVAFLSRESVYGRGQASDRVGSENA